MIWPIYETYPAIFRNTITSVVIVTKLEKNVDTSMYHIDVSTDFSPLNLPATLKPCQNYFGDIRLKKCENIIFYFREKDKTKNKP